ncbi:N-acetylneuraminate lyase [Mycoplasmopsis cricetuli]|uniref:N-acetylneuraminate lyase n=1 Tax=Mycoplasmopsis cricetuli TaxID=171283 RepID=UPI000470C16B|nr:N-acetylneuraminate lyase [Mycoplasmopsis cricetuli]
MKKFEGLFPALVTPFDENGKLSEKGLRELVDYLIEVQKVDGFYLTGSTGEFLLLSFEEKKRILEIVADQTKNRVTLIAQIGDLKLEEVIEYGLYAKKLGYDAVSAITPYYYSFNFEEIKEYYKLITEHVDLPMFIYYLPQLANAKIGLNEFGELLKIKNVAGAKYGSTDIYLYERLVSKYPDKFFFFSWDEALGASLTLGAKGWIGSTYNVNALGARKIINAFQKGDFKSLQSHTHSYNDYIQKLISTGGVMKGLKAILRLEGVDVGDTRVPFAKSNTKTEQVGKEILNLIK